MRYRARPPVDCPGGGTPPRGGEVRSSVARNRSTTAWVVAGVLAAVVVVASLVVIVVSLRSEPPTTAVPPTSDTTSTTTTVTPTTGGFDDSTTTVPPEVDEREVTLQHGGRDRTYLLVTPRDVPDGERLPVVVVLHGMGVHARATSKSAEWHRSVEEERFVAAFPQGIGDSWNMGPCCPPANLVDIDDFGFLDAVLDDLVRRDDVDPQRVYMTGFSNGGVMTYAYACRRTERLAAIGPMAGSNLDGCAPSEPLSLLHQHSDSDPVVPYHGGLAIGRIVSSKDFPDVPSSVGRWAERSGCETTPARRAGVSEVEHIEWPGCDGDVRVELVRVPGRAHNWLKKGDYDPLDELLRFFDIA